MDEDALVSVDEMAALVAAAVRAPSGDNTQPWRFAVDRAGGRIVLRVDPSRDRSPMNAGQRMARIACGAALENLSLAARARCLDAEIQALDEHGASVLLHRRAAAVHGGSGGIGESAIAARSTNRLPYDGRRIPADLALRLRHATSEAGGVATHWLLQRDLLPAFAHVIGCADALMFGRPAMRRAFLDQVRWRADGETEDGLPLGSLGTSALQARGLRAMGGLPDPLLKALGGLRMFAAQARRLVQSASGLCVISCHDRTPASDFLVGRALQRAWLALTCEGACAQPMMSLAVLDNVLDHGSAPAVLELGAADVRRLIDDFIRLAPELRLRRPAAILRLGFAPAPAARAGRRPLSAVMSELPFDDTVPAAP